MGSVLSGVGQRLPLDGAHGQATRAKRRDILMVGGIEVTLRPGVPQLAVRVQIVSHARLLLITGIV